MHGTFVPIAAALAVMIAGCVGIVDTGGQQNPISAASEDGSFGGTSGELTPSVGHAPAEQVLFNPDRSARFTFIETACYAMNLMIHLERTHVQTWLPEGFVAEAAEDTYARGVGVSEPQRTASEYAPGDLTAVWLEAHACVGTDNQMHGAAWIWAAVERPTGHDRLALSGFDAYEVCYAGYEGGQRGEHAQIVDARVALGFTMCGDVMSMGDPSKESLGWAWDAAVTDGNQPLWSLGVEHATDASFTVDGLYRIWHQTESGVAHMDYAHLVDGASASPIHYSMTFDCSLAAGSMPADIAGFTSCDEAVAQGTYILGLFLPTHQMEVTFVYEPFEAYGG